MKIPGNCKVLKQPRKGEQLSQSFTSTARPRTCCVKKEPIIPVTLDSINAFSRPTSILCIRPCCCTSLRFGTISTGNAQYKYSRLSAAHRGVQILRSPSQEDTFWLTVSKTRLGDLQERTLGNLSCASETDYKLPFSVLTHGAFWRECVSPALFSSISKSSFHLLVAPQESQ